MDYEPVIGLEFHAQLKTNSKQYCSCYSVNAHQLSEANKHVCPVCLGHPGVLPVLNRESVVLAMIFGLRVNGNIAQRSIFARKQYFYPDLPKGYQITQYQTPLVSGGELEYRADGITKTALLSRAHLEEDTAKIFYQLDGGLLLDFNRAGIPLLEIVTNPCFISADEAVAFANELRKVLRELGVSEASMEDGSFRCEPNISVRPKGCDELRTKTEVKNLNSFATIKKALEAEYSRQTALYEAGEEVIPCTSRWDETVCRTIPMRRKETQADYRYFDEPDLPPLVLDEELNGEASDRYSKTIVSIDYHGEEREFPVGTAKLADFLYSKLSLQERDAVLLAEDRVSLELVLGAGADTGDYITMSGIVLNEIRPALLADPHLGEKMDLTKVVSELSRLILSKKASYSQMKIVFAEVLSTTCSVGDAYVKLGYNVQLGGDSLVAVCAKVIESNEKAVSDIRKGKLVALQVLVGQVMKETKGKAKPEEAAAELKRQIEL
jgi:aspartyl-tRNA(Asn)/glutamyl-tRNA(Gln) amidotransferase subunit B